MRSHPVVAAVAAFLMAVALALPPEAAARDEVGSVIAVKGKALIERERKMLDARARDGLLLSDAVATLAAARARMLFSDDSVLTLGEKSRVDIREYVHTRGKGGKSVFNLIDGKLRAVVGNNEFELRTSTAVAAARGTVILFETGIRDGRKFTTIVCLEGEVIVSGASPRVQGRRALKGGESITVYEDEPLPEPAAVSPQERGALLAATDMGGMEISIPGPVPLGAAAASGGAPWKWETDEEPSLPTAHIRQQPPGSTTTPVNIDVVLP